MASVVATVQMQGLAHCPFKASSSLSVRKGSFMSGSAPKLVARTRAAPVRGNPLLKVEARKTAGAQVQV